MKSWVPYSSTRKIPCIPGVETQYTPLTYERLPYYIGRGRCRLAFRNSPLRTTAFAAAGGGATILNQLFNGVGPAVNYITKVELVEVSAGAGTLQDGVFTIDLPAAMAIGTRQEFTFGDGYRLGGELVLAGTGTRSGTVTYYAGP